MNIVIASGDLYSRLALVTLESLFTSNRRKKIVVYYIGDKLAGGSKSALLELVEGHGGQIIFIPLPERFERLTGSNRNGQVVFSYCYLQDLLPVSVERALLLEADQIVIGDLSELYDTDITNFYIAAVDDLQSSIYKKRLGMRANSPYVNCGMVLYNLKKWRKDSLTSKVTDTLNSGGHMLFYDVQDVINYIVEGGVKVLPPKFNCTTSVFLFGYNDMIRYRRPSTKCSQKEFDDAKNSPVIVHFTKNKIIQPRPWIEGCCHPYGDVYMKIRRHTATVADPLWKYSPGKLSRLANFMYKKVPKSLSSFALGIVHAYLYPMFLYKVLFKTE